MAQRPVPLPAAGHENHKLSTFERLAMGTGPQTGAAPPQAVAYTATGEVIPVEKLVEGGSAADAAKGAKGRRSSFLNTHPEDITREKLGRDAPGGGGEGDAAWEQHGAHVAQDVAGGGVGHTSFARRASDGRPVARSVMGRRLSATASTQIAAVTQPAWAGGQ